jgi:hypothetical protein
VGRSHRRERFDQATEDVHHHDSVVKRWSRMAPSAFLFPPLSDADRGLSLGQG